MVPSRGRDLGVLAGFAFTLLAAILGTRQLPVIDRVFRSMPARRNCSASHKLSDVSIR